MSMTDPIADMLTRIRNAADAEHEKVDVSSSKLKLEIARILKEEGYIKGYKYVEDKKQGIIRVYLKYGPEKQKVISGFKRVSKPGRRIYTPWKEIPRVMGGLGIAILSTSRGILTDQQSRETRVGGEVICYVW